MSRVPMIGQPLEKAEREDARMRDRKTLLATVLFCRHGETDYDPDRFYEAGPGPELNADGVEQAEKLALWLSERGLRPDGIYASPSTRTLQTAAPIARAFGRAVTPLETWVERSMGQWNGRSVHDVRQEDPVGWQAWKRDPVGFLPPDGESAAAFGRRIDGAVSDVLARHPGGVLVIMTHVGPIRAVLSAALQCPPESAKRFVIDPGSATQIEYTPSWPNVVFMNMHAQLFTRRGPKPR